MYELTPGLPSQPPNGCPWPGGLSWPQLPCLAGCLLWMRGKGRVGLWRRRPRPGSRGRGRGCTPMCAQVHLSSRLSSRLVTHLSSGPADLLQPACARGRQEGDPGCVPRDSQRSQGHRARVPQPSCQHWSHTSRHTHVLLRSCIPVCIQALTHVSAHKPRQSGVHTLAPGLKHTFAHTNSDTHVSSDIHTCPHTHSDTRMCLHT